MVRRERLAPPGPKRTAAQSRSGRKSASDAQAEPRITLEAPVSGVNTTIPADRRPIRRSAASTRRQGEADRIQRVRFAITVAMTGTSASSVSTLEGNRVVQTAQYASPRSPATTAASRKDDTNGPSRRPPGGTLPSAAACRRVRAIAEPSRRGPTRFRCNCEEEAEAPSAGPAGAWAIRVRRRREKSAHAAAA